MLHPQVRPDSESDLAKMFSKRALRFGCLAAVLNGADREGYIGSLSGLS